MQTETYTVNGHEVEVIRVDNDYNGNPRYVVHFLAIDEDYNEALRKARTVGGKVYRAKWYGGGIVFQSYDIKSDLEEIIK